MKPIRVLIMANSTVVQGGLHGMLVETSGIDVIGAIEASILPTPLSRQRADVVLIYVEKALAGDAPGLVEQIKARQPDVKVLVLAAETESAVVTASIAAGANGYLRGNVTPPALLDAIRDMIRYGLVLGTDAAPALRQGLTPGAAPSPLATLSERELAVARSVARGWSNQEVAAVLHVSVNTVKTHLRHIYEKLGIGSRVDLSRLVEHASLPLGDDENRATGGGQRN